MTSVVLNLVAEKKNRRTSQYRSEVRYIRCQLTKYPVDNVFVWGSVRPIVNNFEIFHVYKNGELTTQPHKIRHYLF